MNTWKLSRRGLRTVVGLEMRQRIRSRRWLIALVAWFVVVGATTVLTVASTSVLTTMTDGAFTPGPLVFGIVIFFVLGLSLIIVPTFTATSINGDRGSGTLATLQATPLSALEIAAGKLVAAWAISAAFLIVALPFVVWAMVLGSISVWQAVVCYLVMFALIAVVCAIGLGWSALISRSAGSIVMTYLCVAGLTILGPLTLVLATPLLVHTEDVRVWGLPQDVYEKYSQEVDKYFMDSGSGSTTAVPPVPPLEKCTWSTQPEEIIHTERMWWVVMLNPFVIVADAAPLPAAADSDLTDYVSSSTDPLAALQTGVRSLAAGEPAERDDCVSAAAMADYTVTWDDKGFPVVTSPDGTVLKDFSPVKRQVISGGSPIWPWGLAANVAIGGLFFWIAVRRLRVPYGALPRGVRVA